MKKAIVSIAIFLAATIIGFQNCGYAPQLAESLRPELDPDYQQLMLEQTKETLANDSKANDPVFAAAPSKYIGRPFMETEPVGYVVMGPPPRMYRFGSETPQIYTDTWRSALREYKRFLIKIARNIKSERLVIISSSKQESETNRILNFLKDHIDLNKLFIVHIASNNSDDRRFDTTPNRGLQWWRDRLPIPVYDENDQLQLVSTYDESVYIYRAPYLARMFAAEKLHSPYIWAGGNFVANTKGDCLIVNRSYAEALTPDWVFIYRYKCTGRLVRLPPLGNGVIEHIDMYASFASDNLVLVSNYQYAQILQQNGFTTKFMPTPRKDPLKSTSGNSRTYINSVFLNQKVFMPVYGEPEDNQAAKVYSDLGFNVIRFSSSNIVLRGGGSGHCLTYTYPRVPTMRIFPNDEIEVLHRGDQLDEFR